MIREPFDMPPRKFVEGLPMDDVKAIFRERELLMEDFAEPTPVTDRVVQKYKDIVGYSGDLHGTYTVIWFWVYRRIAMTALKRKK